MFSRHPGPRDRARAAVLLAVADSLAAAQGWRLPASRLRLAAVAGSRPAAPLALPAGAGPDLLGTAYEAMLDAGARRRTGAWFTPPGVAAALVEEALDGLDVAPSAARVCDPAVGGGAFLLAAGRVLHARGAPPAGVVAGQLHGLDTDPLAVAVTEASLVLWGSDAEVLALPGGRLAVADGLLEHPEGWAGAFDAVVGNPPFLNQLGVATARSRAAAAALRARYGDAAHGYADTAGLFLLAACDLARPGGRVALVQPESLLAARDAGRVRDAVLDRAALRALWVAGEPVFEAAVRVCAPVLEVGAPPATAVRRLVGAAVRRVDDVEVDVPVAGGAREATWAPLAAGAAGVPRVDLGDGPLLGERYVATAGFRQHYYGLVPFVFDGEEGDDATAPPLVTSGLIDPGACAWGRRPTRFAKRRWAAPRVDLAGLRAGGALAGWADACLVPKVLVATQTRVVEAAVDERGAWIPCTPVITVTGPPDDLWLAAAALMSPPVTAWARTHFGGAALASDAIKLSARQVLSVPLPPDGTAWQAGADLLRAGRLRQFGEAMCAAYGAGDAVLAWWWGRLPAS